eukprot:2077291-Amphidinium_carterae.1
MSSFLEKSLQRFVLDAGTQKPPKCPNITMPSGNALDKLLEDEGSYQRNALSHFMQVVITGHTLLIGEVSRDARNSQDMHVACYADADISGDSTRTAKSTTGYWVEFVANGYRFPIAWCSKRQTSTSVSTAEAELVAMTSA